MHYVYLLRCADNSLYVGETSNLQAREQDHNEGVQVPFRQRRVRKRAKRTISLHCGQGRFIAAVCALGFLFRELTQLR
jgi:predicted GIY-YIG superfamily endonuclease